MKTLFGLVGMIAVSWVPMAHAQDGDRPASDPLAALATCRAIADAGERLNCFDREAALLAAAVEKRDIVVVDRAGVSAARRSLFGFRLPRLRLFGNDGERRAEEPEFTEIETTITRAQRSGSGWVFTLADGAQWAQTDSIQLATEPRAGTPIRIREGALGSYRANIGRAPAIRVRRVN